MRKDEEPRGLAERLRMARRRAALTQQELAALAGVGRQTVARAELGATALRGASARKLAEALGKRLGAEVDAGWLLTGESDEPYAMVDAVARMGVAGMRPHPGLLPGGEGTRTAAGRPFALPSAQREMRIGVASTGRAEAERWQRIEIAPGVEISFQLGDDPVRARAIAELIELGRRKLAHRESRSQGSPENGL